MLEKIFQKRKCVLFKLPSFLNFLIFMLLPPKTIIGPITGGSNFSKKNSINYLFVNFSFLFYKISEFFIFIRLENVVFSTSLLKKHIKKKNHKKCNFNFVFTNFSFNKKVKKKYDFIIYHRKHYNKSTFFPYDFIKKLINANFKIIVVGDKLDFESVTNFGLVSNNNVRKLQSQSKFSIASSENIYSFFTLECISNHNKILFDINLKKQISAFKEKFIPVNFDKGDYKK